MPHFKCRCCHHEWDGQTLVCDWCQADKPRVLEEQTAFERFVVDLLAGKSNAN